MSDLLLEWDATENAADLSVADDDFELDEGLETACIISLFCDRRAEPGDLLPDAETDRRGWWGDNVATVEGDKIGSRLWLLDRAKSEPQTLIDAETYASEALAWLVADKVASAVDVTASFLPDNMGLKLAVKVTRPNRNDTTREFAFLWKSQEAR